MAPADNIPERPDAERVARIVELLNQLTDVRTEIVNAEDALADAKARRDGIVAEVSQLGAPRRTVAERTGLTGGRIQQIVDAQLSSDD